MANSKKKYIIYSGYVEILPVMSIIKEKITTKINDLLEITGLSTVNKGINTIVLYKVGLNAKKRLINEKLLTKINLKNIFSLL